MPIQFFIGHLLGRFVCDADLFDGIQAETPDTFPQMAPPIQIPIVPVEHQSLGRYLSFQKFPPSSIQMMKAQDFSGQQGVGHIFEQR